MEITNSPLINKDTVGNYVINNISKKEIDSIYLIINNFLSSNKIENIELLNILNSFKSQKDPLILSNIFNKLELKQSLTLGYLILKELNGYEDLDENNNYSFLYNKNNKKETELVLLDNSKKIYIGNVTIIKAQDKNYIKIFNTTKIYQISYISLDQRLTGQGLGTIFYKLIYELDNIDVLISSDNLYKGSFSVWSKSLKEVGKYHGIIARGSDIILPLPFNSLESTPINVQSIDTFFISKTISNISLNRYKTLAYYDNKKTLFYYINANSDYLFSQLKTLNDSTLKLKDFDKLVEGDMDNQLEKLNINLKTYDLILRLKNQNIDNTDEKITNVCVLGNNGQVDIKQVGNSLEVQILS